jgi:acetylornithine deacetylase
LSCRLATYPGTDPAELQRRVQETIVAAAAENPFLRENPPVIRYDGFVCEGCVVADQEPLVQVLSGAYADLHGHEPELRPTTATTDARHFIREGIPAVCFGPRAESYHGIDERVSLSSMHATAQVLARFIVEWTGLAR